MADIHIKRKVEKNLMFRILNIVKKSRHFINCCRR